MVVIFAKIMNSEFCLTSLQFEENILVMHSERSWGKTQELESLRLLENFHHNNALKHNVVNWYYLLIVMRCMTYQQKSSSLALIATAFCSTMSFGGTLLKDLSCPFKRTKDCEENEGKEHR